MRPCSLQNPAKTNNVSIAQQNQQSMQLTTTVIGTWTAAIDLKH
jgi:hypothetical protein